MLQLFGFLIVLFCIDEPMRESFCFSFSLTFIFLLSLALRDEGSGS